MSSSFPELRLVVALLDSCELETHRVQGGFVSQQQAQRVLDLFGRPPHAQWLKIFAVHHNPVATVPSQSSASLPSASRVRRTQGVAAP